MNRIPFLTIFPGCSELRGLCGGLEKAEVSNASVDSSRSAMTLDVFFCAMPSPADIQTLQRRLETDYGLATVTIHEDYPRPEPVPVRETGKKANGAEQKPTGTVLFGKEIKSGPVPMSGITLESGKVTVEGDVIAVSSRMLQKRGSAVLCFDLTDKTNTVRISRFLRSDDDKAIIDNIREGDHLTVKGEIMYSKFEDDIVLDPQCIVKGKRCIRTDDAPEKRVELHAHTKFSTLDALTDPAALVERAAYWGMPAVAVTDHGGVQAFPEMWSASKKKDIKIIYGTECYFVNDMEGSRAVWGDSSAGLDAEFVAFDIETTGLNAIDDRMTEIGAVIMRNGEEKGRFNTFVNPGMHIPDNISELTKITDKTVADAPDEEEALRRFIEFAGDRPLVAHNAVFDIGFMKVAANRHKIKFDPVFIDTLAVSKAMLGELKRFKLDTVSKYLKLPEFEHHRASDDALACGRIMQKLIPMLSSQGARTIADINGACARQKPSAPSKSHHMILLVTNKTGLKNLYKMISESFLKYFHRTPTIPKSLLVQHREGILVGSACGMGELYEAVMEGRDDWQLERIASFYDYLEIQPLCNNGFLVADGRVKGFSVLENYNRRIYELGKRTGIPVVAASDVHFMDAEDEQLRKILQCGKKFEDADRDCPIFFRTTDEMLKEFEYLGKDAAYEVVVTNTRAIADRVEKIQLFPKELFPPKIENSAEQLTELVNGKMHRIYGENPPEIVKSRVETELKTILDHNYDVIYMSAQKLVQNSLENGYLVGSRGSVGSSIVAYMSGITEVNSLPPHYVCPKCTHSEFITDGSYGCGADMPEKNCPECGTLMRRDGFDIPFETFLGFPGNEKTPDIDLNFSGEYQAKVHKYTETLFGSDHVFRAGTIGTLAEKTAYGYVLKYLEEHNMKVSKAEENRLALGLVGIKRTTGQHPGGLVVIPQDKDVTDFCPVQHPADDPTSDIITTHFEYHSMEDNLLKLDELGHDDPTMIRMMEDMTGRDAKQISLSDAETMSIFTSPAALGLPDDDPIIGKTGTIGVPEFGTGFTKQMLVDTQPKQFNTLVRLSGFSHGTDVWAGNIHDLIVNGVADVDETVGCRDDIMLYLIQMGMEPSLAFKFMEAVRKGAIHKGKKWPEGIEDKMKDLGVPDWWVESCRKIQYLFPKAHAVAYVMMAFRIAWFKVHEPLAFYSAYFYRRSQKGGFDAEMMTGGADKTRSVIEEMRRREKLTANEEDLLVTLEAVYEFNMRGFEFAPLDLYESDVAKFLPAGDNMLRPPFISVAGLGEAAARDLYGAVHPADGSRPEFISVDELAGACPKLSRTSLEQLGSLGALRDMPETSQISLF